tara:strand:- start:919 stop:1494 length:576 start_codon:yes stop_codon:yes gene_type:complete
MSATLNTTNIKHASSGSNNIVLASDGKVTFPQNTGNILQVVSTTKTDVASASINRTSDWVGHGLSVSITPSSASNQILIFGQVTVGSDINDGVSLSIFKAGSEIAGATGDTASSRQRQTAGAEMDYNFAVTTIPFHYLDTAGGTSSITYQPALNISNSGSYTIYLNRTSNDTDNASYVRTMSVITAMEIAA